MLSELERKRFLRIANRIGANLSNYEEGMRQINGSVAELHRLVGDYAERLRKVPGADTLAIDQIIAESEAAFRVFEDPKVIPALDAVLLTFGDSAETLAKMTSAIPTDE